MASQLFTRVCAELGVVSLWQSSADVKLLCAQRFTRLFAYGGTALILVSYLAELGISTEKIGLFMTLTLVGDVGISFFLTLLADALGRKAILATGALMMTGSGIVFALSGNYWILLLAAIFGVISPAGNEIGPFRAIEESTLSHLTPPANRGDVFAWYSLLGSAGIAFGSMASGWSINYMRTELHWTTIQVYRAVFCGYALLGLVKFGLTLVLSPVVEAEKKTPLIADPERAPLLGGASAVELKKESRTFRSLLPDISPESRIIVGNLCVLFALDSFASGLVPPTWIAYFFKTKFSLPEEQLGNVFFTTSFVSALSMLVASSLAKRIGNVKTMVFTHLPSSIFLALIPVPSSLPLALVFFILRASTASMDGAPRSAFVAAVIRPNERTSMIGLMNVVKTSAQALGPFITGVLANHQLFWVAFLLAGTLKATYDLGLLAIFAGHKTIEERDEEARQAEERERPRETENPDEP